MSLETEQAEQLDMQKNLSEMVECKTEETKAPKISTITEFKKEYIKHMTRLGAQVCAFVKKGIWGVKKGGLLTAKGVRLGAAHTARVMKTPCAKIGKFLTSPILRLWARGKEGILNVKTTYKEKGAKPASLLFFKGTGRFLCGSKGVFVTAFNYVAPIVSIVFLVTLVNDSLNTEYGIEVNYDGDSMIISNESVLDNAEKLYRTNSVLGNDATTPTSFSIERLGAGSETMDAEEIADVMLSNTIEENNIVEASSLLINGVSVGIVSTENVDEVNTVLDSLLAEYATGKSGEVLSFVDEVEFVDGLYRSEQLTDVSEVVSLLTSDVSVETYYTVVSGDAPLSIAEKNNISYDDLLALNPTITTSCFIGDKVVLSRQQPYLSVCTTYTETYDTAIDYEIIQIPDETMYIGATTLIQAGVEGQATRTAEVIMVNGYETGRNIISETIISEPVEKRVKVGAKTYSGATLSMIEAAGDFMWPLAIVQGEYISSSFGYRTYDWSYHNALDIACPRGTPIYASADGYVSMSQYRGAYGNLVIIDHGNGYETYYAHCSSLLVSAGTNVKKGDLIALVGMTGSASGNHLHFEFRYNGTQYDPLDFIDSPVAIKG